jgi:hypothetical protein
MVNATLAMGHLQFTIFYNNILGLGKTTKSQDQFLAIQGGMADWLHVDWTDEQSSRAHSFG